MKHGWRFFGQANDLENEDAVKNGQHFLGNLGFRCPTGINRRSERQTFINVLKTKPMLQRLNFKCTACFVFPDNLP